MGLSFGRDLKPSDGRLAFQEEILFRIRIQNNPARRYMEAPQKCGAFCVLIFILRSWHNLYISTLSVHSKIFLKHQH
jgi:hypothetical protein